MLELLKIFTGLKQHRHKPGLHSGDTFVASATILRWLKATLLHWLPINTNGDLARSLKFING